jgi:ABC-2 type transport system permease protein
MREYWILSKLQLSSLFGINKIRHMKNSPDKKKAKRSAYSLLMTGIALAYFSVFYSLALANAFAEIGMLPTLLGLMAFASTALLLMFSVFETKGVLFGFGDYDIVMSWPVGVRAVAASRVTSMYAYNFVYAALLLIPAGVIYAGMAQPAWWYYPLFILMTLLIPALPTIIGAILGTLLTVATAKMKKRNIMNILGQMVLVFAIMFLSFRMSSSISDVSGIQGNAHAMQALIERSYPPAVWFQNALTSGSWLDVLGMAVLFVVSVSLLLLIIGKNFVAINSRIKSTPTGETFVMRSQARSGRIKALFRNEMKRYFNSSLYVVNTAFSYVMLLAAGIFCIVKAEMMAEMLNTEDLGFLRPLIPFVLAWIVSMGTTTSSAISMEGKTLWIVKSMPVTAREWLTGKLMVSLSLAVPSVLIGCTMVSVGTGASPIDWFWMYLVPLSYAVAFGVFGLWLNIRMPKLDWQGEAEVVKQSGATMVCVFAGMGAVLIPAVIAGITASPWARAVTVIIVLLLTLWMWRSLVKHGERRLLELN